MLSRLKLLAMGFNKAPIAKFLNLSMSFKLTKQNNNMNQNQINQNPNTEVYQSIIKMKYIPNINNFVKGNINGGIYSLLIDNAAGFASMVNRREAQLVVTNNLNVNYFRPASEGELIAVGKIIKQGKNIDVCEASVYNNNIEIARGNGTFFVTENITKKQIEKLI